MNPIERIQLCLTREATRRRYSDDEATRRLVEQDDEAIDATLGDLAYEELGGEIPIDVVDADGLYLFTIAGEPR